MSANKLSVYLNVNGAEEAEAKLKRLGKYGDVALKGISTSAEPVNKSLIALNDTVGSVSKSMQTFAGLAGAYLGFQGLTASAEAVKLTNIEFQKLSASLKVVEGDAETADNVLTRLDNLAKQTPYAVQSLTEAWIKLGALGLKPSEEALISYGNTSSAMGKDIMQFIEAVADASTFEFERLKEFGIKASQSNNEVAFTFQGTTSTIKKNASDIQKYLLAIGNTQFAGAMTEQMNTIGGAISNRDDQLASFQRRIGNNGFNSSLQEFYTASGSAIAQADNLADGIGAALGTVTNGATILVKNLDILKDAALAFGAFKVIQVGATATTAAMAATTLATRNMALALGASSAIAGKAATVQIAAMTAMGTAARGLTAAMGLVGGPLGVIAIAGFSVYQFAKRSDAAAEASNKYAAELKEVEKNAKSLTLATDKLNDSTEKQTRLKILDSIDEAKKAIADITEQIKSTEYTEEGFFSKLFSTKSAEEEILNLKQQLFEGEITIEEFRSTLTSMGEQDIKFRKPALKVNELTKALEASELALNKYQEKLKLLDNPSDKPEYTPETDRKKEPELNFSKKKESLKSLMAQAEYANSSVGNLESLMNANLSSDSWIYGALNGLDAFNKEAQNMAKSVQQMVQGAFGSMTDSLVEFTRSGKLNFTDFTNSIINDMIRMQIQQNVTGPIAKAFSGAITSYFGGEDSDSGSSDTISANVNHVGGIAGSPSLTRDISASYLMDLPRHHSGGEIRQDEYVAILQKGEEVLSRNAVTAIKNGGRPTTIIVKNRVYNYSGHKVTQKTSEDENGNITNDTIIEKIEGAIAENISRNRGPLNGTLRQEFKTNGANI